MGQGSGATSSCGVGRRHGSDPGPLWLWHRPAATAPIRSPGWEPPYAASVAPKRPKKKKKVFVEISYLIIIIFFVFLPFFLGSLPRHMEAPSPGVLLELQPPAYTRATATWDLSRVCNPLQSPQQRQIPNPPSKTRDRTRNPMVPSQIR